MSEDCNFNISDSAHTILKLKLSFISIGIFTSVAAIIFLIPNCKIRIFRIILYAMIANSIEITLQLMELFPENHKNLLHFDDDNFGWDLACKSFGFLDQCTTWMGYLCMTWVSMYVIYLYKKQKMMEEEFCSSYEVIGIGICFLVPFLFNWIPFVDDYYGSSGAWCWIQMVNKQCSVTEGQVYMTLLYYVPLFLFVTVNVISCIYVIRIFFTDPKYQERELIFVLFYPWFYGILSIVVAVSRIKSIMDLLADKQQSSMLWKIHAVSDPLRMICMAVLVIIAALCRCRCCSKYRARVMAIDNNKDINRIEADEESLLPYN